MRLVSLALLFLISVMDATFAQDHWAKHRELRDEADAVWSRIRNTKDCSLVPLYMEKVTAARQACLAAAAKSKMRCILPELEPFIRRLESNCGPVKKIEEPSVASSDTPPPTKNSANIPAATCSSTITGKNLPPAPKGKCDEAKKLLIAARAVRKEGPGAKSRAEPAYQKAAAHYRAIGDKTRADLVIEEAMSDDIFTFEQAERDAEQRPENLKQAANLKDIARKIELGAYESKSCGDLRKAADYYFQAARFYLKAREFAAFNALALRRDQLETIVDDARKRGACDGRLRVSRLPPTSTAASQRQPLTKDQCQKLLAQLDNRDLREERSISAQRVELVPLCNGIIKVAKGDCLRAGIYWMDLIPPAERTRKLRAAGCHLL